MADVKKAPRSQMVPTGIELLELLSSSPGQRIDVIRACAELHIDEDSLVDVIDVLSQLSDARSGAHAAISMQDGAISLLGDAAELQPVRLGIADAAVLEHVLGELNMDDGLRRRAELALLPFGYAPREMRTVGDSTSYGLFYQMISEAIEDGARCRMSYRSSEESSPGTRTIDPHTLVCGNGAAFLSAWNVESDSQRLYRLDRIESIEVTEDSVVNHPFQEESVHGALRRTGIKATLRLPSGDRARSLGWSGLDDSSIRIDPDGEGVLADVYVASETWLFNQVLSLGGEAEIISPGNLRDRLPGYAVELSRRL